VHLPLVLAGEPLPSRMTLRSTSVRVVLTGPCLVYVASRLWTEVLAGGRFKLRVRQPRQQRDVAPDWHALCMHNKSTDEQSAQGWILEPAHLTFASAWRLTNHTGEDVRHVQIGFDDEPSFRIERLVEGIYSVVFYHQPQGRQRLQWASDRFHRKKVRLAFPQ
jgi:hypothetical protein